MRDVQAADDDDEDVDVLGVDELSRLGGQLIEGRRPAAAIESNTDSNEWKLEVERVLPQLRAATVNENKVRSRGSLIVVILKAGSQTLGQTGLLAINVDYLAF